MHNNNYYSQIDNWMPRKELNKQCDEDRNVAHYC